MKQVRLNQIIAIEKQVKTKVNTEGGNLHKLNQKSDLFNGMSRTYERKDEDGEELPGEKKLVQLRAEDNLESFNSLWTELVDVVATKDYGNCSAKTDVVVNGETLVKDVPVTHLIWMEKQLDDYNTFVNNLPTLEPGKEWKKNETDNLYESETVKTSRNKKTKRALVKYDATDKHPAQTEVIEEDILVGYWLSKSFSGAMTENRKKQILSKVDILRKAVKSAREEANSLKIDHVSIGKIFTDFLCK